MAPTRSGLHAVGLAGGLALGGCRLGFDEVTPGDLTGDGGAGDGGDGGAAGAPRSLSLSRTGACTVLGDGTLWCWGEGSGGTLGTGNHFVELCLDEAGAVWVMLHSGSRGIGNRIGSYFIERAKAEMRRWFINLPDVDLAYLPQGSDLFKDYLHAVGWAQAYARVNRDLMMRNVMTALGALGTLPPFEASLEAVNCHHNYVSREAHFGESVIVTRKGAVRVRAGELGIIPGSMGARSFIVRGKGSPESFDSCSHGAGRAMSRTRAKKVFTLADHAAATAGVECRKDADVLDETPGAYKSIDAVMAAQADIVDIVHTLKQVVCVKG